MSPKFLVHFSVCLSHFTKLNLSYCTETNSSYGGLSMVFEGPCLILVSVTENNYCLVAEGNLEKKYGVQKYHTPLKLENEVKKNYCCLKV